MNYVVVDGKAFRILQNGIVQASDVVEKDGKSVIENKWEENTHTAWSITGFQFSIIRTMLKQLADLFPDGRAPLPSHEAEKPNPILPTDAR